MLEPHGEKETEVVPFIVERLHFFFYTEKLIYLTTAVITKD